VYSSVVFVSPAPLGAGFCIKQAQFALKPDEALEVVDQVGQPILMVVRAMPMVRTARPMRYFWPANTCPDAGRAVYPACL
jgi:hypothetical protein